MVSIELVSGHCQAHKRLRTGIHSGLFLYRADSDPASDEILGTVSWTTLLKSWIRVPLTQDTPVTSRSIVSTKHTTVDQRGWERARWRSRGWKSGSKKWASRLKIIYNTIRQWAVAGTRQVIRGDIVGRKSGKERQLGREDRLRESELWAIRYLSLPIQSDATDNAVLIIPWDDRCSMEFCVGV